MTRFLIFLAISVLCLLGLALQTYAMGVTDFVAVADEATSAIFNPAGLVEVDSNALSWHHRFTGRDLAGGWDDLAIYAAPGDEGTGALYLAYSQDLAGINLYWRTTDLGYAYGWRTSDIITMGLSLKYGHQCEYQNVLGEMQEFTIPASCLMMDFGLMVKPSNMHFGLAIYDIGSNDVQGYYGTVGLAYQNEFMVLAGETTDLFDALGDSLFRLGCRFNITPNFRLHLVSETSDWGYSGQLVGAEFLTKNYVTFDASYYKAQSPFVEDSSLQASVGYRF